LDESKHGSLWQRISSEKQPGHWTAIYPSYPNHTWHKLFPLETLEKKAESIDTICGIFHESNAFYHLLGH